MDYFAIATQMLSDGKTVDEIISEIKVMSYENMINGGVNEFQAEMFSYDVVENIYKHCAHMEHKSTLPKSLSPEQLDEIDPITDFDERKEICGSCEYLLNPESTFKRCDICNCFMEIKMRMAPARCPLGKW